jgi:hypothetical protein
MYPVPQLVKLMMATVAPAVVQKTEGDRIFAVAAGFAAAAGIGQLPAK